MGGQTVLVDRCDKSANKTEQLEWRMMMSFLRFSEVKRLLSEHIREWDMALDPPFAARKRRRLLEEYLVSVQARSPLPVSIPDANKLLKVLVRSFFFVH